MNSGVIEYQLQIYNKWGELLFESKDVNRGWDGYYRGQLCKQDVYVWKVVARFVDGQLFEKAGDVTLLVK
jgi:gliding motility-associated-like protein